MAKANKLSKKEKNWLFYHVLKIFKWVQTNPKIEKIRKQKISKENEKKGNSEFSKKKTNKPKKGESEKFVIFENRPKGFSSFL